MNRFISIREKLVLFFVFLGILCIGVIGYLSYKSTRSALLERTFDQLTSLRIEKKKQVEQFVRETRKDMRMVVATLYISDKTTDFIKKVRTVLNSSHYEGIILAYPDSEKIRFNSLCCDSAEFTWKLLESSISTKDTASIITQIASKSSVTRHCSFIVSTYIPERRMYLILPVTLQAMNAIMYENNPFNGLGKTGETYLVDDNYFMRTTSRFNPASVNKIRVLTPAVVNALHGETNTRIIHDYRNIPVLSSFDRILMGKSEWVILAEMDLDEAMIPVMNFRNFLLIAGLIVSLIFIIISYFVSQSITRALRNLNHAVSEVGKGNFKVTLNIGANDEIGELTRSFNAMARKLNESALQLEEERLNRTRYMLEGQENERLRLSRELHDGLGQQLIGLRLNLENLKRHCPAETAEIASGLGRHLDTTIEEVRRMSNDLMPSVLQEFGITNAVRNLCSQIPESAGLTIVSEISGNFDTLSTLQNTHLFRFIQEALTNVVKHAQAKKIQLSLRSDSNRVTLSLSDDGTGFSTEELKEGEHHGIFNMRERASLLNGSFYIHSSREGTAIALNFPVVNEHH